MNTEKSPKYAPLNVNIVSADCTAGEIDAEIAAVITVERTNNEEIETIEVSVGGSIFVPSERGNSPQLQQNGNWLHTYDLNEMVMCDQTYEIEAFVSFVIRPDPATATPVSVTCGPCGEAMP